MNTQLDIGGEEIDEEDLEALEDEEKKKTEQPGCLQCMVIPEDKPIAIAWEVILSIFTIYSLFATPFILVFSSKFVHVKKFELAVDLIFLIDIFLNFFKATRSTKKVSQIAKNYALGYMIFDIVSVLPGLVTLENFEVYPCKIGRFVRCNKLMTLLNFIFDKLLFVKYNKTRLQDIVDFVTLLIFVFFGTHVLACMWCYIGLLDSDKVDELQESWLYKSQFNIENIGQIYMASVYFVIQTITTVGYGDQQGSTSVEYIFSMVLEFVGLTFFSFMMGSIGQMLHRNDTFEDMVDNKMNTLDLWIKRIERSNKPFYIPPKLYGDIKGQVQDSFLHDFNLIIEEYPFYSQLSPKMQNELVSVLFKDFQRQFKHMFDLCERGFINELIINMYCKSVEKDSVFIHYGSKFDEIYFIMKGGVHLYNKYMIHDFIYMPQYAYFGDYQIFYDLKSNIVFRTANINMNTFFMCVSKKVFLNLCELFPRTAQNLKTRSLERRQYFMQHMIKLDNGPLKAIKKTMNQISTIRRKSILEPRSPIHSNNEDEDPLEQFFSDEDPASGAKHEQVEDIPMVIKKMDKRTTQVLKALKEVGQKMDQNFKIVRHQIDEGLKPGCFQDSLNLVADNFRQQINFIKCTRFQEKEQGQGKKAQNSTNSSRFSNFSSAIINPKQMKLSGPRANDYIGQINQIIKEVEDDK